MKIAVKKLDANAVLPQRAHESDAGLDLYALAPQSIAPGARVLVGTGVAIAVPEGHAGLVWDKSGLANKYGLKVLGGVVDAGYQGEVMVGILNTGQETYTVEAGDKIAQMLVQQIALPEIEEVTEFDATTTRGTGGFGSTGK